MVWAGDGREGVRMVAVGAVVLVCAILFVALGARAGPPPPASPVGRPRPHGPGVLREVAVDRFPTAVSVDERANRAFVVSDSMVTVLDGRDGAPIGEINQGDAGPVAVATDTGTGRVFVVNRAIAGSSYPGGPSYHNPDGSVDVFDARSLRPVARDIEVRPQPLAMAVDARRRRVFVLGAYTAQGANGPDPTSPGSVVVLDARSGHLLHAVDVGRAPTGLAIDVRSGHVFVTNRDSRDVTVIDGDSGRVVRTVPLPAAPLAVAVVPPSARRPGGRVFVATIGAAPRGRSVIILDARSGAIVGAADAGYGARALAVDTRRDRVFVVTDDGIGVLDGATGAVLRRVGAASRRRPRP